MRRKIEKFLSEKQGVSLKNIRYLPDGRYDFMGDLEGVLAAVRGTSIVVVPSVNGKKGNSSSADAKDESMEAFPTDDDDVIPQPPLAPMVVPSMYQGKENYPHLDIDMDPHCAMQITEDSFNLSPRMSSTKKRVSSMNPFGDEDLALSPAFLADLSPPPNASGGQNSNHIKDTFSNDLFSPGDKSTSMFSPAGLHMMNMHMNGMTPLSSIVQDNFVKTPFGSNGNDPFLFSPQRELNRKLFATSTKKPHFSNVSMNNVSMNSQSELRLAEVSVSPIIDMASVKKSHSRRRSYFTRESLEGPIQSLSTSYTPQTTSLHGSICLGIVPLKASMSVTPSTTAQRTPVDVPIATPSVAGSAYTNADLSLSSTLGKSIGESESSAPKRHLFSSEETVDMGVKRHRMLGQ